MKTVAIRLIVAALLFAAGAACWAEARRTRQVADAHARLATLHYDDDGAFDVDGSWLARLPILVPSLTGEVRGRRATATYWRSDYADLRPARENGAPAGAAADPVLMFVAANAAFRTAQAKAADRTAAVAQLDGVVQSYGEVLRRDPGNADAAYNYEYVVRFRDRLATERPGARGRRPTPPPDPVIPSADLPTGSTIHGRPGAPPPEIPGDEFRTIAPMPYEEREETDPGVGVTPRRRG